MEDYFKEHIIKLENILENWQNAQPKTRELSLAITNLEQCIMWAYKIKAPEYGIETSRK